MDTATGTTSHARPDRAQATQGSPDMDAQLAEIRKDLAALVQALGAYGRTRSAVLADSLRETSHEALADLKPLLRDVQNRLAQAEKDIERDVREHPGRWLGGVLGVVGFGILMGLLFGRRS